MKQVKFKTNSISSDEYFLVSEEDYERVILKEWRLQRGHKGSNYVREATHDGLSLHRFILEVEDSKIKIDHKNMNPLDNTRENLRICDSSLNAANKKVQRGKKSSKYKGVFKRSSGKFRVIIGFKNKTIHCGQYDTEDEAALVYNKKATELFGEFANLNKVGDQ